MDIYPGDKLVARGVRMLIGNLPIFYFPKLTQDLSKKKPIITFVPGHDKDWGSFVLSQMHYQLNENLKGVFHLDAREKKGIAWGFDTNYKTKNFGSGNIRTYYMDELTMDRKNIFSPKMSKTISKERFRVEWRHKWDIDKNTNAIMQYYKVSDSTFLKDYFQQEFDQDFNPDTYALVTRTFPKGVLSIRSDIRVNRFESKTERLPEIRYDLSNFELGDTGLFWRNQTSYTNFSGYILSFSF